MVFFCGFFCWIEVRKAVTNLQNISVLLKEAKSGKPAAKNALFGELVVQLRSLAEGMLRQERSGHTLQATALVNETCLKILQGNVVDSADNRRQLFFASIRAMRQVLVDHARARNTLKRGSGAKSEPLDYVLEQFEAKHCLSYLELEIALEKLQAESPRLHETISLRFFAGLTIAESAEVMGCSDSRVESDWRLARAKLLKWIGELA